MLLHFKDTAQKSTIAALDGVRAFACLSVVAYHLHLITNFMSIWQVTAVGPITTAVLLTGYSGVTLFFILSGFLLFMPYAKALLFGREWPSMRKFYLRRALRILPGYYVSLLLIMLWLRPDYFRVEHLREIVLFLTFTMDSAQSTYQKLNGPFWTLAVEWQFYMLLPFLALGFRWLIGRGSLERRWWKLMGCLAVMIVWGILSRYAGGYLRAHPTESFGIPHGVLKVALFFFYGMSGKYLEDFAIGMFVSCCYVLSQQVLAERRLSGLVEGLRRHSLVLWGSGIALWLFVALWNGSQTYHTGWQHLDHLYDRLYPAFPMWSELVLACAFGSCVLAVLLGPAALRQPFEWGPLRWIGLISYGVYIWHLPMLVNIAQQYIALVPQWSALLRYALFWAFVLVVVLPFSFLFYKIVEQPWIRLGNKLRRRTTYSRDTYREGKNVA